MRNLLLFVLFLIGLFYARRALRGKGDKAGRPAGEGQDEKVIRFCFAKRDETLAAAFERLERFC